MLAQHDSQYCTRNSVWISVHCHQHDCFELRAIAAHERVHHATPTCQADDSITDTADDACDAGQRKDHMQDLPDRRSRRHADPVFPDHGIRLFQA